MGLEFTELVFAIEERYGIVFLDDDGPRLSTVGDLVAVCRDRIRGASPNWCVRLPAFLVLRRMVRKVADDPELLVHPRDKIADVLMPAQRRELWQRLPNLDTTSPTGLRRPLLWRIALTFAWFAAAVALLWPGLSWPVYMVLWLAFGILLNLATRRFKTVPPGFLRTFGDVARRMPLSRVKAMGPLDAERAALFDELRPMIAEVVDMREEEISLERRLVEDLGMG